MHSEDGVQLSLVPFPYGGYQEVEFHRSLVQDFRRTKAFQRAISTIVEQGDIVADLGAGNGILSFFACKAGAKKVYAIEIGDILQIAPQIAKKNGMEDRIVFINEESRTVDLPEQVDVIISECIGYFVFGGDMISAVSYLRDSSLRDGGVVIPRSISMFLSPVQSTSHYNYINYWQQDLTYGIDFSPIHQLVINNTYLTTIGAEALISEPANLSTINLLRDHPNEMLDVHVEFPVSEPCTLHGLCGWFEVDLCDGVSLSTSPMQRSTVWKQIYFPVEKALSLKKGDGIVVDLVWRRSENEQCSCLDWAIEIGNGANPTKRITEHHSTRNSYPFDVHPMCKTHNCEVQIDGKARNMRLAQYINTKKINELKTKESENPEDPTVNLKLARYYRNLGYTELAAKEMQKGFLKRGF